MQSFYFLPPVRAIDPFYENKNERRGISALFFRPGLECHFIIDIRTNIVYDNPRANKRSYIKGDRKVKEDKNKNQDKDQNKVREEKERALEAAIGHLEKEYGKGAVMKLGESGANMSVETVPTGSLSLDIALGVGGIPKGRIIEIYGPESSGKTTVALHMVAEVQKKGGIAGFVDAEHALDPVYARNIGVDIDNLYISQPDSGEQALEITETMVRSGAVDIIVVDSVAALTPQAEIDGEMGDSHMGLQARLMSQALRKLTATVSKTKCIVVFINQLREKIGVMFGNPETTTGGRALKFYASIRLDVRRVETLKAGGEVIGNRTRIKVVKNKVAPPFKEAQFDIMFGRGISRSGDILDLAVNSDIVEKSGAWFAYKGEKIGQGRENAKLYLEENPEVMAEIEQKVREIKCTAPDGTESKGQNAEAAVESMPEEEDEL
jgi:recombination protein RecA